MKILSVDDLTHGESVGFEGKHHDGAGVSFFVVDAAPGARPLAPHVSPEFVTEWLEEEDSG